MLNRVILIGRVTSDVELKEASVIVANFTLAVDRGFKGKDGEKKTDFVPVTVFGKLAETCAEWVKKGSLIAVEGRIQIENYENKDGEKRTSFAIIGESVKFLSLKK